ncbi:hypothetical protein COOONC_00898 [Cooperia oncophora]
MSRSLGQQTTSQTATGGAHQISKLLVTLQPSGTAYQTPPQSSAQINSTQSTASQNFSNETMNPCPQDSPRTADLAGDSPHMPNSGQSETVAETGDGTVENPITFDDPSSILTPAALSHFAEEMLRRLSKRRLKCC